MLRHRRRSDQASGTRAEDLKRHRINRMGTRLPGAGGSSIHDGAIMAHELTFAFLVRAFLPETRILK